MRWPVAPTIALLVGMSSFAAAEPAPTGDVSPPASAPAMPAPTEGTLPSPTPAPPADEGVSPLSAPGPSEGGPAAPGRALAPGPAPDLFVPPTAARPPGGREAPPTDLFAAVGASAAPAAPAPRAPGGRPRFEVAVGMGVTGDRTGYGDGLIHLVPGFFAQAGFGAGLLGLDGAVFSGGGVGRVRAPQTPIDRLAVDLFAVVRPAALRDPADQRRRMRVLRGLGLEFGPALERVTSGRPHAWRSGLHLGGRLDVPLTAPGDPGELRLRLGARRMVGLSDGGAGPGGVSCSGTAITSRLAAPVCIEDTRFEVFGALAVVF